MDEEKKEFLIGPKYAFTLLLTGYRFLFGEGPSATAKSTMLLIAFCEQVRRSKKKLHVIAGLDLGVIEKNLIDRDFGLLEIQGTYHPIYNPKGVLFFPRGKGNMGVPHIWLKGYDGKDKIILLAGYKDVSKWKKILGGQYGVVYIDEMVHADMAFVRQIFMRSDVLIGSSNPDDPDKEIYKEYINRCRPLPQLAEGAPPELVEMLNEPAEDGWIWGYYGLDDNIGLPKEKKEMIIKSHTPGTVDYMHYVQGIRGKAEGIIFDNFDRKKHCVTEARINEILNARKGEKFILFTSGLDTAYSQSSPDTVAMSFLGITNERNIYLLAEEHYNGQDNKEFYSPSEIVEKYIQFLEKNRNKYGFARDTFIDSADQATISELRKYKNTKGSIYNFNNAYKALKIIDRIQIQKGWFATGNMFINENCSYYIKELQTYHWDNKKINEPCDSDDHMINSIQYAWIPYKDKIGEN